MSVIWSAGSSKSSESDFNKDAASSWNADIFVIRMKPQGKNNTDASLPQKVNELEEATKGEQIQMIPRDGCSNKNCVLVQKNKKQRGFF